jgi:hypothetical protein
MRASQLSLKLQSSINSLDMHSWLEQARDILLLYLKQEFTLSPRTRGAPPKSSFLAVSLSLGFPALAQTHYN